jgi:uncharacterized Fe-S center protein
MSEPVYLIRVDNSPEESEISKKIRELIQAKKLLSFIEPRDFVAVKTHFGEKETRGYVRPSHFRMLGELIQNIGAFPFLTETSTLYRGNRSNAVEHIHLAIDHGFSFQQTGLPIIMSDGLLGDDEVEITINSPIYKKVKIAKLLGKVQALVLVSHFTGHILSGFGAALKNLGMGCASRRGKLIQHSTAKPSIKTSLCTGCGECMKWCPADAITVVDGIARINRKKCIGCAECLATCRFDAVGYNWSETHENLQKKMVEHALGVMASMRDKMICINFLTRITKDCDCMRGHNRIMPDIGILLSHDPVAIDAASIDLAEKSAGKKWSQLTFDVPNRVQIEYAAEIGLGNPDYRLEEM